MAILDDCEVEVIVDGEPLNEYDDDDEPEPNAVNTVTKYVEAVSGKEYQFRITIGRAAAWGAADLIVAKPDIEGKKLSGICISYLSRVSILDGQWSGGGSNAKRFKYTFADLETRDTDRTDNASQMKAKYGDLGTLKLSLWRERELSRNRNPDSIFNFTDLGAVPEKALKGRPLEVSTKFKAETGGRRPDTITTEKLDLLPFATFIFKYRTRNALKSLFIIERSPTPVPLEERNPDDLTREELQELLRRERAAGHVKQENTRGVKRERSGTVPTTPSRRLKTSKLGGKTVFHLDSSDEEGDDQKDKDGSKSGPDDETVDGGDDVTVEVVDLT